MQFVGFVMRRLKILYSVVLPYTCAAKQQTVLNGKQCRLQEQCDLRLHCLPRCICQNINPHLPSRHAHPYQWDKFISSLRGVWCTFSFLFCFEWIFLLANSEEPDQMPHSANAASDLCLRCLPMSQKWDTRLIWVKNYYGRICP